MDTKFKRHQKVKLLSNPLEKDIEPYADPPQKITAGTTGTINVILPNGRYHIKIEDKNGDEIAYVVMDEEQLEAIKP
jgi:hypothetical protein